MTENDKEKACVNSIQFNFIYMAPGQSHCWWFPNYMKKNTAFIFTAVQIIVVRRLHPLSNLRLLIISLNSWLYNTRL